MEIAPFARELEANDPSSGAIPAKDRTAFADLSQSHELEARRLGACRQSRTRESIKADGISSSQVGWGA